MLFFLLACPHPVDPPPCTPVEVVETVPLELGPLDSRVVVLLSETQDLDQRERLAELQELIRAANKLSSENRIIIARYVDRVLAIEERSRPMDLAEPENPDPIQEVPLQEVPAQETQAPEPQPPEPQPPDPETPAIKDPAPTP
jgi:hypothetical protein